MKKKKLTLIVLVIAAVGLIAVILFEWTAAKKAATDAWNGVYAPSSTNKK